VFDMVIAGQDKPFAGALIWPSPAALPTLGDNPLQKLTEMLKARIAEFNRTAGGSSRRIGRFMVMVEPPSIDAGEITDKGYVNQRATLERRAALVDALYANPPGDGVVVV
jgi:feruloyl-CoA synthase